MSGYSKNPQTGIKMLPYLGPIVRGELCAWNTEKGEADYFAYKIREALYVARLHADSFGTSTAWYDSSGKNVSDDMLALAKQAERIRIVVVNPSLVEARLQKATPEALVLTGQAAPMSGYENPGRSTVTLAKQTVWSIQEAWRGQQPSNTPLHFPHAGLSYDELVELYTWAESMHLMLFEADGALTIQPKSLDLLQYAWSPRVVEEDVPADEFPFKD
jgi:hypothetical protein